MTIDRPLRVLVVDDDEGVASVVSRALAREGYEILVHAGARDPGTEGASAASVGSTAVRPPTGLTGSRPRSRRRRGAHPGG